MDLAHYGRHHISELLMNRAQIYLFHLPDRLLSHPGSRLLHDYYDSLLGQELPLSHLEAPFSEAEVSAVIKEFSADKAPGPDGMTKLPGWTGGAQSTPGGHRSKNTMALVTPQSPSRTGSTSPL